MITYRTISCEEVSLALFDGFNRAQNVTRCWRKIGGKWVVKDIAFLDDWTETEYREVVRELSDLLHNGGFVAGAFSDGQPKGFIAVDHTLFGSRKQYMNLAYLIVSEEVRGLGIGTELMLRAKAFAKLHGAESLYISAHSAVETQAFYRAMGCTEAEEYNAKLAEKEPCDCQLECRV